MLLLHVSDIHFKSPNCDRADDPERPYRQSLIIEASSAVAATGSIDAILITGDIAFAGKASEYDAAIKWFGELADAVGCTRSQVFVVPGNHDVDRGLVAGSLTTANAIDSILSGTTEEIREKTLERQLGDPDTGAALVRPITAYNNFARRYRCRISREDLTWTNELRLDATTVLRLRGLNTALLCGRNPERERGQIFLGGRQTSLSPEFGVLNMVLAHHPPEWLFDQQSVEDRIFGGPNIVLFGHTHRADVLQRQSGCVVVTAGSANPDRGEKGWEPAFGMLKIDILGEQQVRDARIRIWQYRWQRSPAGFVQVQYGVGASREFHKDYTLPVHGFNVERTDSVGNGDALGNVMTDTKKEITEASRPLQHPNVRAILLRVWNLSIGDRREIIENLSLIAPDFDGDEDAMVEEALIKAASEKRLLDLSDAIAEKE